MWNFICVTLFVFVAGLAADATWHCGHPNFIQCLGVGAVVALLSLTVDLSITVDLPNTLNLIQRIKTCRRRMLQR